MKLVEAARAEAARLIKADPELISHPALRDRVGKAQQEIHLE
jgi:hypothetical protein